MELWEAQVAIGGLPYRDRYVLDALRLYTAIQINGLSTQQVQPTDLMRYPWDDECSDEIDNYDDFDREALLERSVGYLDGMR